MKIQNIVAGLLLVIAAQGIYGVENTINNWSGNPVRITLIYKNGKKEVKMLEAFVSDKQKSNRAFIVTTKANPIKKIVFSYIGTNGQWIASLDTVKDVDQQYIGISDDGYIALDSFKGGWDVGPVIQVEKKYIEAEMLVDEA